MGRLAISKGKGPFDTTPNAFTFTPVTGASLSFPYTSNTITIAGMTPGVSVAATITGGQYSRNGAAAASVATTATNGTTFAALQTSSALNSTLTSAVLTVGGVSGSYDVTTTAGASIPVVGPSALWNPSTGNGDTAPIDPPRTGAKAIMQIATATGQRTSSNLTIYIPADAYGGITKVRVGGACLQTDITTMYEIVRGTWWDGRPKRIRVFAITMDIAAFLAASASGNKANLWFEVYPTNTNIQRRVISGEFTFYPEATDYTHTLNVGSAQTYTTVQAAVEAAVTLVAGTPTAVPRILLKDNAATYPLTSTGRSEGAGWPTCNGLLRVDCDPGETATLNVASFNVSTLQWTPGWNGMQLNTGITVDVTNWTGILASSAPNTAGRKPWFFNGCAITNPNGRDNNYWLKSFHPGWGCNQSSYFLDVTITGIASTYINTKAVVNSSMNQTYGDQYSMCYCVLANRDSDNSTVFPSVYYPAANDLVGYGGTQGFYPALEIWYTGGGTATYGIANPGDPMQFTDPTNGSWTVSRGSSTSLVDVNTGLVAAINAKTGWHASLTNNSYAGIVTGCVAGSGQTTTQVPPITVTSTHVVLVSHEDPHGDVWDQNIDPTSNLIFWDLEFSATDFANRSFQPSSIFRFDGALGIYDISVKNCLFFASSADGVGLAPNSLEHILIDHNNGSNPWGISAPNVPTFGPGTYSSFTNNTMYALDNNGTSWGTTNYLANVRGNVAQTGTVPGPSDGTPYSGNSVIPWGSFTTFNLWFADIQNNDFTPVGSLAANLVAPTWPYDSYGNARAAMDYVGYASLNSI